MAIQIPFTLKHISHSAANKFLTCGERFRLEKVEGFSGPPHLAAVGGSAFHEWTERYDKDLDGDVPVDTFLDIFGDKIDESMDKHGLRSVEDFQSSKNEGFMEWRDLGCAMAQKYIDWRIGSSLMGWAISGVEIAYTQDVGLSVPAHGYIDREFWVETVGGTVLVDIKTNKRMPTSPQLFEYAAIRRIQGHQIDGVAYYNARQGTIGDIIDPTPWTDKWLREYYGHVIGKIQRGEFKANPGFQCAYCPVAQHCSYKMEKK